MQVDPARLVELAASSQSVLTAMAKDWAAAQDELGAACERLGDATGTMNVTASYLDALTDAGQVVTALAQALDIGVTGLIDAARDVVTADETVASEITRTTTWIQHEGFGGPPGRGGRR